MADDLGIGIILLEVFQQEEDGGFLQNSFRGYTTKLAYSFERCSKLLTLDNA